MECLCKIGFCLEQMNDKKASDGLDIEYIEVKRR